MYVRAQLCMNEWDSQKEECLHVFVYIPLCTVWSVPESCRQKYSLYGTGQPLLFIRYLYSYMSHFFGV